MKQHTSAFKEEIKNIGRQMTDIISYDEITLMEEIFSVSLVSQANILKSIMKQLTIESNVAIPNGTIVNYKLGLLIEGSYEYIDYGNYVVFKTEKQEDTNKYLITCYDKMLYSMKQNEQLPIVYPITIKNYLQAIANKIGLELKNTNFMNQDLQIPSELYVGLEYTYRDILDEIAQATGSIIIINKDDQLEVKYPTDTGDTITEEYLKDVNVTFGEKYGPINSIVLSRAGESDNVYLRDEESVLENGLCEVKIVDNQIMNFNNRSDYLEGILSALNGFEYYINDFSSTGILYYDIYDKYNIQVGEETYNCIMLNDEINRTQGVEELIHTDMPEESETDYTKADKTDRRINKTYIIVDKQNQTIESVVSNVTTQNQKISRIEQTVDELNSKISDIADVTISKETMTGSLNFENINASEPIRIEIKATGENISYLYPFDLLHPANDLFIKLRTLRFRNISTNEVFDYELPDDLLYYDSENFDSFLLDYDSQATQEVRKVFVYKKCKYNTTTGAVELLETPRTDEYEYPSINLTDGNYIVEMLKYDNTPYACYLFARLMIQNIYTTQFATKAELNSEISQTSRSINLSVDQKLTNYSTTSQMNSAINLKANEITSSVSETYATKDTTNSLSSRIKQTAKSIELVTTDNTTSAGITIRLKNEDGTQIDSESANITMSGLVKFTDLSTSGSTTINGANITTGIIKSSNYASGSKGTSINLSNGVIDTRGFKVDQNGNITATSGTIGGFNIDSYRLTSGSGSSYININSNPSTNSAIWIGAEDAGQAPFRVTKAGALKATNANIEGTIKATNGVFENCTIKKSCTVPASTVSGTLATNTIPNISAGKITSGTMSGDRINGGRISTQSITCTDIYAVGSIEVGLGGSFVYDSQEGEDFQLIVNDGEKGWRRLTFKGGILVNVEDRW